MTWAPNHSRDTQQAGLSPEGWEKGHLSDHLVGKPKNGYSAREVDHHTGTSVLGLGCLTPDGFKPNHLKQVLPSPRSSAALLEDGDLLISRSNTRELVGLAGVFKATGSPTTYPDLMMRLTAAGTISARYLEALLRSPELRRQIQAMATGTSGSMVKISSSIVQGLEVVVPPLPEQARIAEVLDTLDEAIRATEEIIAKLQTIRQAQLHELMTRGIAANGELRPLQADAPPRYRDSPLGWIPKEWEVVTLRDAALPSRESFIDGDWIEAPFITSEGIRLIQTGNIGVGEFIDKTDSRRFISADSFRMLNCKWVVAGDILICRLADPIGRACIVPDQVGPSVTSVDCTIFRVEARCFLDEFVLAWVNAGSSLKRAQDNAAGSTRSRISRKNLGMLPIAKPTLQEQQLITNALKSSAKFIADERANLFKLKDARVGLMHDLLTGRVRTVHT